MATLKSREGCTYRHRDSNAIVLCIKTRFMSQGTARHTLLVIDAADSTRHKDGSQTEMDETPMRAWNRDWEEV